MQHDETILAAIGLKEVFLKSKRHNHFVISNKFLLHLSERSEENQILRTISQIKGIFSLVSASPRHIRRRMMGMKIIVGREDIIDHFL